MMTTAAFDDKAVSLTEARIPDCSIVRCSILTQWTS